jgi:hypothetical protein
LLQRTTAVLTEKKFLESIPFCDEKGVVAMEAKMPGDPKECRQHARNCMHLAKGASTPELRDHFAKLSRTWLKLAEELEQTEVFLAVIDDDDPTKQTG